MVYPLKTVIFHGYVSHNQMVTMKNHGFRESNGAPFRGLLLWVMLKGSRGKPWRKTPRRMITLSRLWGSIVTCHGKIWKSGGKIPWWISRNPWDWEWWIQGFFWFWLMDEWWIHESSPQQWDEIEIVEDQLRNPVNSLYEWPTKSTRGHWLSQTFTATLVAKVGQLSGLDQKDKTVCRLRNPPSNCGCKML